MVDSIVNNEALMKSHAAIITKSMCYGETLKLQPDEQEPCKLLISVSWPSMGELLIIDILYDIMWFFSRKRFRSYLGEIDCVR